MLVFIKKLMMVSGPWCSLFHGDVRLVLLTRDLRNVILSTWLNHSTPSRVSLSGAVKG
jgi:hypothetical protein